MNDPWANARFLADALMAPQRERERAQAAEANRAKYEAYRQQRDQELVQEESEKPTDPSVADLREQIGKLDQELLHADYRMTAFKRSQQDSVEDERQAHERWQREHERQKGDALIKAAKSLSSRKKVVRDNDPTSPDYGRIIGLVDDVDEQPGPDDSGPDDLDAA